MKTVNKYEVTVEVTGYVKKEVYAESADEAETRAMEMTNEEDFGALCNIEYPGATTLCLGPVVNDLSDIPVAWDMCEGDWKNRFSPDGTEKDLIGIFYIGKYSVELFGQNDDHAPVDVYVYGVPGYSEWDDGTPYSFADDITFDVPYEASSFEEFKSECEKRFKATILQTTPSEAAPNPIVLALDPIAPWAVTTPLSWFGEFVGRFRNDDGVSDWWSDGKNLCFENEEKAQHYAEIIDTIGRCPGLAIVSESNYKSHHFVVKLDKSKLAKNSL